MWAARGHPWGTRARVPPSTTDTSGKSSAQQLLHSVTVSVIRTARSTGSMQQVAVAIYFFLVAAFFLGAVFFLATAFFGAVLFLALMGLAAALGVVTLLAALQLGLAATGFCAGRRRSAQPCGGPTSRGARRASQSSQHSHTLPHPTAMQAATRRGSCGSCADAPRG